MDDAIIQFVTSFTCVEFGDMMPVDCSKLHKIEAVGNARESDVYTRSDKTIMMLAE